MEQRLMQRISLQPDGAESPIELAIERVGPRDDRERAAAATVGRLAVLIGDRRVEAGLELTDASSGCLHLHGRIWPFHGVRRGDTVEIWIDGRTWKFELPRRMARRTAAGTAAASQGHLTSPMPGTVLKVNVRAGEAFSAHQPLVVMESMKMEMTLSAPHAGRIGEVCCAAGQLVEMGAVLLRFRENGE
jgi:acetyl/propionyl-CoA carboxylase alpha subunit